MCSITGMGERLHKVLGQIGSNLWFLWQQKAPIDLEWEKQCLHLFSVVFSGRIRLLTLELLALERWKFYTFELEYLWGQSANLDQILCVASVAVGKGCILFWGRLDQNSGVHGNRKPPLTYNGENGVSTFSQLLLIRSFLYLQITRTCIKSRTSLNFGQIGPLTMEQLAALEGLKNFP